MDKDNSQNQIKAEYWRSYTASLLFQTPEAEELLNTAVSMHKSMLLGYLADFQAIPTEVTARQDRVLEGLISTVIRVAQELRCQRKTYEVGQRLSLGDTYNGSSMIDLMFGDEPAVVSCVVSNGIIRRPFSGSKKVEAQICKARVYVSVPDEGGVSLLSRGTLEFSGHSDGRVDIGPASHGLTDSSAASNLLF